MFVGITRQVLVSAVRTGRVAGRHNFSTGRSMRGGHGHEKEQGWAYRNWDDHGPKGRWWSNVGLCILTATYWWMFHGIFTEPEHIIGHGEYMDVTKLTDAQLGIPAEE